jgi:radical SAM protein with 4Fe4S-binding SPASM domain
MFTPFETVDKYLAAIRKNVNPQKATFYIHGGETFLAPISYLRDITKLIHKHYPDIRKDIVPQTNLTFKIKQDFLDYIREDCYNSLGVSWDADIRFDNKKQEDLFFKNLKILLDEGIRVNISITAQRHLLNYDPIEIAKMFEGVDSIDFELLTTFDEKTRDLKPNNKLWADWLDRLVDYYQHNEVSWCLPQVDLFTKTLIHGQLYECKCNCCDKRTFTLNPNGTVGFCPDRTYIEPQATVDDLTDNWQLFEEKGAKIISEKMFDEQNAMCFSCEHYDICGGNCDSTLFDDTDECPLSKKVVSRVRNNINRFAHLYNERAKSNLIELRTDYEQT